MIHLSYSNTPTLGDTKFWNEYIKPVKQFLRIPKTWSQLEVWGKENGVNNIMMTNALAYMAIKGHSRFIREDLTWVARNFESNGHILLPISSVAKATKGRSVGRP